MFFIVFQYVFGVFQYFLFSCCVVFVSYANYLNVGLYKFTVYVSVFLLVFFDFCLCVYFFVCLFVCLFVVCQSYHECIQCVQHSMVLICAWWSVLTELVCVVFSPCTLR